MSLEVRMRDDLKGGGLDGRRRILPRAAERGKASVRDRRALGSWGRGSGEIFESRSGCEVSDGSR